MTYICVRLFGYDGTHYCVYNCDVPVPVPIPMPMPIPIPMSMPVTKKVDMTYDHDL